MQQVHGVVLSLPLHFVSHASTTRAAAVIWISSTYSNTGASIKEEGRDVVIVNQIQEQHGLVHCKTLNLEVQPTIHFTVQLMRLGGNTDTRDVPSS